MNLGEITTQPGSGYIRYDVFREQTQSRPGQRALADVRGKDLDRHIAGFIAEILQQGDGHRVGFLACRTARHPDADRVIVVQSVEDPRKDLLPQRAKHAGVTEKARDVDEQILVQRFPFLGMVLQVLRILLQRMYAMQRHAPLDAPLDRTGVVMREVHPGRRPQ